MNVQTFLRSALMGLVLWGILNASGLFVLSRRRRRPQPRPAQMRYVFVVPALNESAVIEATVRHLLALGPEAVLVVDDGSSDNTSGLVRLVDDNRVILLSRSLPNARLGKGVALNAAYQLIRQQFSGSDIAVCVIDADGRLSANALEDASCCFADPNVGACQVSVRIRNRRASFWTRMQHFEFLVFASIYQRGRDRGGAVGLGGNGQFVRLNALVSLGEAPWTSCLVEDMDLGIRLLLSGWRNRYIPTSHVSQQAVPGLRSLLRQRTRWFQGTLQCVQFVPRIMASERLPLRTRMDLVATLLTPAFLLAMSPLLALSWLWLVVSLFGGVLGVEVGRTAALTYVVAAFPSLLLSYVFWIDEPDTTFPEAIVAGHAFVVYGYMWMAAGWRAAARMAIGRNGWAKTARVKESATVSWVDAAIPLATDLAP